MWKNLLRGFLLASGIAFLGFLFSVFLKADLPKKQAERTQLTPTPVPPSVEIVLTGDVMLGRSVMTKSFEIGDAAYPFRKVVGELAKADLVFINLESPIISGCPKTSGGFKFCADPRMVEGLTLAGVDVVSLANNHAGNFGVDGLNETVRILKENGIEAVGLGNLVITAFKKTPCFQSGDELNAVATSSFSRASPKAMPAARGNPALKCGEDVIKKVGETEFGFLGFDYTFKPLIDADLELIKGADEEVDVLVVGVHWGEEYKKYPSTDQKEWAKAMVVAGADVVVGHHPHWVQDVEYYYPTGADTIPPDGWNEVSPTSLKLRWARPVYYSLGNFVFDQMWSEETKKGMVVKLTFQDGELVGEERMPTYMSSWAQSEFVKVE